MSEREREEREEGRTVIVDCKPEIMPSSPETAKQVASYRGVVQLDGARYVLGK